MAKYALPATVRMHLGELGRNIGLARRLKGMTMEDCARRAGTTRNTLYRLERGNMGVSLGVLASVLWVLGMDGNLPGLASPENDPCLIMDLERVLPKRVTTDCSGDFDEDF